MPAHQYSPAMEATYGRDVTCRCGSVCNLPVGRLGVLICCGTCRTGEAGDGAEVSGVLSDRINTQNDQGGQDDTRI